MKIVFLILCILPTAYEVYQDRHGESAHDKVKDTLWAVVASIAIAGASHLAGEDWVAVLLLMAAIRIAFFDYAVTIVLYRNHVIESRDAKQWWRYTGKTALWDRIVSKADWRVRLGIRLALFVAVIVVFEMDLLAFL